MPFFKKSEVKCISCDISGWEDLPCSQLTKEWANGTGLCEDWGSTLQQGDPPQVVEALHMVIVEK